MKPVQLTFQAFGPFSDKQVVDFDKLGHAPLFLINGPTGAGKSTLLDAICFALYGETTGSERTGDQMRCDQADPKQLTFVDFTFSLAGQQYRIERSPEQQVPKLRGEGTTKKTHNASLFKIEEQGEALIANRPNPVAKEVVDLIGLDVKQFRQVMVIPQGRFRELLTANSKDREQIFGQLFSTHIYRDIERVLFEQAADIRKQKDQFDNQIKGVLELAEVESEDELGSAITHHTPQVTLASETLEKTKQDQDLVTQQLQQANELAQKFVKQAQLQSEQQRLENQRSLMDQQRMMIKRARLAISLAPAYQAKNHSQQAYDFSAKKYLASQQLVQSATQEQTKSQVNLEQVQQQAQQLPELEKRSYQLQAQIEQLKLVQLQAIKLATSEQSLVKIEQTYQRLLQQLAALDVSMKAAHKHHEQAKQASLELPLKEQQEKALDKQLSVLLEIDNTRKACMQSQQLLESANNDLQQQQISFEQTKTHADTLEYQWHSTQAAQLAALLNEGEACPVCGSESHPSPAQYSGQLVSKNDVEQARAQQQQVFRLVEQQQAKVQTQQVELGKIEKALEGWTRHLNEELSQEPAVLQQEQARLAAELLELRALNLAGAHQQLTQCEEQITALQASITQQENIKQQALQEKSNLEGQLASVQSSLGEKQDMSVTEQALTTTLHNISSLKQKLETASHQYNQASQQLTVASTTMENDAKAKQDSELTAQEQCQYWFIQLEASEFSDESEYLQGNMPSDVLEKTQQQVEQFDQASAINSSAVQQIYSELKGVNQPDITTLVASVEHARETYQQALTEHTRIQGVVSNLLKVKARLAELYQENDKLDKAYQVFGTLSDVANGKTGSKISLHRFVLGVLLDDVLVQATQRLRLMSKGRYELLRKEQRAKGNVGSGLDLLVEDAYSGKTRDVATLSGGESFMAALALALGLSDVVQSYSGGIRLDTLFIDEGFGSLDPESLDLAIQTLMELQQTGRTIGIISHVSELKEQMSLRIDVTPSRTGSQLSISQ
ncbi:SMC family ATPase [Vibrio sp. FNV 38]|nr:SMC family ATPase [Vibrio sp. FNV 38]